MYSVAITMPEDLNSHVLHSYNHHHYLRFSILILSIFISTPIWTQQFGNDPICNTVSRERYLSCINPSRNRIHLIHQCVISSSHIPNAAEAEVLQESVDFHIFFTCELLTGWIPSFLKSEQTWETPTPRKQVCSLFQSKAELTSASNVCPAQRRCLSFRWSVTASGHMKVISFQKI